MFQELDFCEYFGMNKPMIKHNEANFVVQVIQLVYCVIKLNENAYQMTLQSLFTTSENNFRRKSGIRNSGYGDCARVICKLFFEAEYRL